MRKVKKSKGITLIALVITIIVLLILAGVSIAMLRGDNNIITKASTAKERNSESSAKEKLELTLLDLQTDKATKSEYNEEDYINQRIQENDMSIDGDIVFVDEWQFEIDRSVPEVVASLGKGEKEEEIQIEVESVVSNDFEKATLNIKVIYEKEIKSIRCNGEQLNIPQKNENNYLIEKDVTKNGTYTIIAQSENEKYNIKSLKVSELTEDMKIYTAEQLEQFRDKVNLGGIFRNKKITLMNDIKLDETKQWIPIGKDTKMFQGTFDGNKKIISGININNSLLNQGLFGTLGSEGTIKDVEVLGSIKAYAEIGGIVGINYGYIIGCTNRILISASGYNIGGIAGRTYGTSIIKNCCNLVSISGGWSVGGIVGANNGVITGCYNIANISSVKDSVGGLAGLNGWVGDTYIRLCI